MEIGYKYSLLLHFVLIGLLCINLPSFSLRKNFIEDEIITIESFIISDKTNIPKAKKQAAEKKPTEEKTKKTEKKTIAAPKLQEKEEPAQEKPAEETPPKKIVDSKKLEKTSEVLKSEIKEPKPLAKKEVKEKPQEKPQLAEKKMEKAKDEEKDFDSLLKDLEAENSSLSGDDKNKKGANIEKYDPTLPLSLSEKDAIKSQIMSNWSIPAGGRDLKKMYVVLKAQLDEDGTIKNIEIKEKNIYDSGNNKFYQIFIDSAVRAMQKASPLQGLSTDKYNSWRDLEIYFDPRELVN